MEINEDKFKEELSSELLNRISSNIFTTNDKGNRSMSKRFNRKKVRDYLIKELSHKKSTNEKLLVLDKFDEELSNAIDNHIGYCHDKEECYIEKIYLKSFEYLDYKKNEILATKSFFEKTIDNPSSMGIFFIGLVNLAIAAFHIYRQIKVD